MHCQFRSDLADTILIDGLAAVTDPSMDLRASRWRQETVRHLEIQDVAELVTWRDGAVGQFDEPARREKLIPSHQRFTAFLDPFGRFIESRGNGDRRALHADDTRSLEDPSLVRTETLDLLLNQLSEAIRDPRLDFSEAAAQLPLARIHHDDALVNQILDEVHHEQWV